MRKFLATVAAAALLAAAGPSFAQKSAELPSFAPVIKRVAPAVVNIGVRGTVAAPRNPFFDDPGFRRFFGLPPDAAPREREFRSAGSGVIVDAKNGYIVTNAHVIKNASEITITLVERAFRVTIIVAASLLLARYWGLGMTSMAQDDGFSTRLLRGGLNAAIIFLAADIGWNIVKALMEK